MSVNSELAAIQSLSQKTQFETISWVCRRCRRPSFLMFQPNPKPDDYVCRGCKVRLAEGLPIEIIGSK